MGTKLKKGTSRDRISKNAARLVADGVQQDSAVRKAVKFTNKQIRDAKEGK